MRLPKIRDRYYEVVGLHERDGVLFTTTYRRARTLKEAREEQSWIKAETRIVEYRKHRTWK